MYIITLLLIVTTLASPLPPPTESCTHDIDCMHGFPTTSAELICTGGRCKPRYNLFCVTHADCPGLQACTLGECVHGAEGVQCDTRDSCGVGLLCKNGRCKHGLPNDPCSLATALECADGLVCTPDQFGLPKCAPGVKGTRCLLHRNCAPGLQCLAATCTYGHSDNAVFFPWSIPQIPAARADAVATTTVEPTFLPYISVEPQTAPGVFGTDSEVQFVVPPVYWRSYTEGETVQPSVQPIIPEATVHPIPDTEPQPSALPLPYVDAVQDT